MLKLSRAECYTLSSLPLPARRPWEELSKTVGLNTSLRIKIFNVGHVILLTDAHEAPAYELIEALASRWRQDPDRRRCEKQPGQ